MNLAEFRKQYPQYDSRSDAELATALYDKHYKKTGMSLANFADAIEMQPEGEGGIVNTVRSPLRWPTFKAFMGGSAKGLLAEESMMRDIMDVVTGNTKKSKREEREEYFGDPVDRQLGELAAVLDDFEAAGKQDTPQYMELAKEYDELNSRKEEKVPDFSLKAFKEAVKKDPGAVGGEVINSLMADSPYIFIGPVGWEKAAASAAVRLAKFGKTTQRIGTTAAGIAGGAAAEAAIMAPISAFEQINESGTVDEKRFLTEVSIAAGAGGLFGMVFARSAKALREVARKRGTTVDDVKASLANADDVESSIRNFFETNKPTKI